MAVTIQENESRCLLRLDGEVGVASSEELKQALLHALASGKALRFDLEQLTELGVTTWQLLWAAAREAQAAGLSMGLVGQVPDAVAAALREAGFEEFPIPVASMEAEGSGRDAK